MIDTGLFGPGSATWRISGEGALMLGGGRALIMQVAHPLVGAGVEQHSRVGSDRWGRLVHTLDVMGCLLFGDSEAVARATRRVAAAHRHVSGTVSHGGPAGQRYRASDPELLLWVWATLVDTTLLIYSRYVRVLEQAEIERFYEEQKLFARACGVPIGSCPPRYRDFVDYVGRVTETQLEATPIVHVVTEMVLNPLGLPSVAQPLMGVANLSTVGLLPPQLRAALGLRWTPAHEIAFAVSSRTIRAAMPLIPPALRRVRSARRADRRISAAAQAEQL